MMKFSILIRNRIEDIPSKVIISASSYEMHSTGAIVFYNEKGILNYAFNANNWWCLQLEES